MRDDRQRLLDIHEAIERIEKYTDEGRAAFEQNELIQNWIVHHLQIIGEASRNLSASFRNQHPEIAWSDIIGMRNVLVHHYFDIDIEIVWSVVEHELPDLERKVEAILKDMERAS